MEGYNTWLNDAPQGVKIETAGTKPEATISSELTEQYAKWLACAPANILFDQLFSEAQDEPTVHVARAVLQPDPVPEPIPELTLEPIIDPPTQTILEATLNKFFEKAPEGPRTRSTTTKKTPERKVLKPKCKEVKATAPEDAMPKDAAPNVTSTKHVINNEVNVHDKKECDDMICTKHVVPAMTIIIWGSKM